MSTVPGSGPNSAVRPIIKVFSATMAREREGLGDAVTNWLRENRHIEVVEVRTMQSSDEQFHCITIIVIGEVPL